MIKNQINWIKNKVVLVKQLFKAIMLLMIKINITKYNKN